MRFRIPSLAARFLMCFVGLLLFANRVVPQEPTGAEQDEVQAKIASLAAQLGDSLQKAHEKKVVVFDFIGPRGLRSGFGRWLADQFSAALAQGHPGLQLIDRSAVRSILDRQSEESAQTSQSQGLVDWETSQGFAKEAQADIGVSGPSPKQAM